MTRSDAQPPAHVRMSAVPQEIGDSKKARPPGVYSALLIPKRMRSQSVLPDVQHALICMSTARLGEAITQANLPPNTSSPSQTR